jgi:hypothetical protein
VNCLAQLSVVIFKGLTMAYSSSSEGQAAGVPLHNITEAEAMPGGPMNSPTTSGTKTATIQILLTTSTKEAFRMQ